MSSITIFSSAGDGVINSTWSPWATCRAGNSLATTYTSTTLRVEVSAGHIGANYRVLQRIFLPFDTSSIPDDATINSATLSMYCVDVDQNGTAGVTPIPELVVCESSQVSTSSLVNDDWDNITFTAISSTIARTALVTGTYNNFTITDLTKISKTGFTKLALLTVRDVNNTDYNNSGSEVNDYMGFSSSEQTGTSQDPKLVIDYTDNTTTSTTTSTSTTSTSSSTTHTNTSTTTTSSSTSSSTTTTSTSTTSTSTTSTTSSTTTTSSSTTSTSSSTTMPFSLAVDNV